MGRDTKDPLVNKNRALKAALAAVEDMNGAGARRASRVKDLAAKSMAKSRKPNPAPAEHRKTSEA